MSRGNLEVFYDCFFPSRFDEIDDFPILFENVGINANIDASCNRFVPLT